MPGFSLTAQTVRMDNGVATALGSEAGESPKGLTLFQNKANPLHSETLIEYHLAEKGQAKLEIFNALGQSIEVLVYEVQDP